MSDRILDRWIAENAYNFKVIQKKPYVKLGDGAITIPHFCVSHYTSDMNEAIKLLEISSMILPGFYAFYDYCTILDMDDNVLSRAKIDQPALAICLAFYKLKTGKDWGDEDVDS